nr:peptidase C48, SUMO/sentrin/Ubl1 [Tanacetum cinerariifolium]
MRGLSPERKKVIREMGFGDLIEFLIFEIPNKLAFYIVDILNTTNMTLECLIGDIVITPKIVKQVLGLPVGRRILERKGQREYNDPFLLQWKDRFRNVNKLTIKVLSDKREIAELQNDYMGIGEIQDDVGEGEEPNQKEELNEMLEENIHNILIEKLEIEEKINENLIKFQDDEKLLQLKKRMKKTFKEPEMPEYLSSSSSESDDDNGDGSQLANVNEEIYRKEKHSNDEDDVEIVAEVQKDKRNETHYTVECIEKKDEHETETSKKDEANNNKEEGMENTKAKNQKIVGEVQKDGRNENQNIAEWLEIDTSVIDAYVSILNYEEKKFKMTNMKRHFFYTSMMVPGILEDKTKEIDKKIDVGYDRFHEMLSIQMENDVEKMKMKDVKLSFFPIIAHGHYYLIVFNLKTGKPVIIDNSESDATYEGKYKDNVEFVVKEKAIENDFS